MLDGIDQYREALDEDFGLNVSDEDLMKMLEVAERRGEKGAPRPFFS